MPLLISTPEAFGVGNDPGSADAVLERRTKSRRYGPPEQGISTMMMKRTAGRLALVAFAIAWLLRRAGARRDDDDEESYTYNEPALDTAALNRKLDTINLDLDVPPTDEPRRIGGPRV